MSGLPQTRRPWPQQSASPRSSWRSGSRRARPAPDASRADGPAGTRSRPSTSHDRHVRLRLHAADRAHQHLDLAREGLPLPHLAAEVEAARRRGDDQDAPGHQEVQRQDRGARLADARLVGSSRPPFARNWPPTIWCGSGTGCIRCRPSRPFRQVGEQGAEPAGHVDPDRLSAGRHDQQVVAVAVTERGDQIGLDGVGRVAAGLARGRPRRPPGAAGAPRAHGGSACPSRGRWGRTGAPRISGRRRGAGPAGEKSGKQVIGALLEPSVLSDQRGIGVVGRRTRNSFASAGQRRIASMRASSFPPLILSAFSRPAAARAGV